MKNYFTKFEITTWTLSVIVITLFYLLFGGNGALTLIASLIGVTSLVFSAKGNPIAQALMIVFSIMYGIISYSFRYYGEMATYLGMTLPMSVFSLISWLKNPYKSEKAQVKVDRLRRGEWAFMALLCLAVTAVFYFILKYFDTPNLLPSTISVTTSFAAAYLTFRRNPCFPLAYAANDVVLILMWILASVKDLSYLSVIICFVVFLVFDLYGFFSWCRMEKKQKCDI